MRILLTLIASASMMCVLVSYAPAAPESSPASIPVTAYPSIQQALDLNPGKMLFVPAGDHLISERIRITKDGAGLWGPGRIIQTNDQRPIVHIEGAADVRLREITLTRSQGHMEVRSEAVIAIGCRNLVLDSVQVFDNRTRTAAIELRNCVASQIRNCLVQNYQSVSIDDRTGTPELGYSFRALIGTGIVVKESQATLVQGNRVIERNLRPTRELQRKFNLGQYDKKNAVRGVRANKEDWDRNWTANWLQSTAIHIASPTSTDLTQVIGNYVENTGQGFDIHADHVILSQNIVHDTLVGMKAMHGSRNVLIMGNQFVKNDLWSIGLMPGASSHAAEAASDGKEGRPANVDGGSIIMGNIISDFGYGSTHWIRGEAAGFPIRFEGGQKPDNPPLRSVIVQGNMLYDPGRDKVLVDGVPQTAKPRYRYAIYIAQRGGIPRELHFMGNVFSPGFDGVSNVDLPP